MHATSRLPPLLGRCVTATGLRGKERFLCAATALRLGGDFHCALHADTSIVVVSDSADSSRNTNPTLDGAGNATAGTVVGSPFSGRSSPQGQPLLLEFHHAAQDILDACVSTIACLCGAKDDKREATDGRGDDGGLRASPPPLLLSTVHTTATLNKHIVECVCRRLEGSAKLQAVVLWWAGYFYALVSDALLQRAAGKGTTTHYACGTDECGSTTVGSPLRRQRQGGAATAPAPLGHTTLLRYAHDNAAWCAASYMHIVTHQTILVGKDTQQTASVPRLAQALRQVALSLVSPPHAAAATTNHPATSLTSSSSSGELLPAPPEVVSLAQLLRLRDAPAPLPCVAGVTIAGGAGMGERARSSPHESVVMGSPVNARCGQAGTKRPRTPVPPNTMHREARKRATVSVMVAPSGPVAAAELTNAASSFATTSAAPFVTTATHVAEVVAVAASVASLALPLVVPSPEARNPSLLNPSFCSAIYCNDDDDDDDIGRPVPPVAAVVSKQRALPSDDSTDRRRHQSGKEVLAAASRGSAATRKKGRSAAPSPPYHRRLAFSQSPSRQTDVD